MEDSSHDYVISGACHMKLRSDGRRLHDISHDGQQQFVCGGSGDSGGRECAERVGAAGAGAGAGAAGAANVAEW